MTRRPPRPSANGLGNPAQQDRQIHDGFQTFSIATQFDDPHDAAAQRATRGDEGRQTPGRIQEAGAPTQPVDPIAAALVAELRATLARVEAELDRERAERVRERAEAMERERRNEISLKRIELALEAAIGRGNPSEVKAPVTWSQIWEPYGIVMARKRAWWPFVKRQLRVTIAVLADKRVDETKRADWLALAAGPLAHLSAGTRNLILKRLRACIKWAATEGEILPLGYKHPWQGIALEEGAPPRESEPADDDLEELVKLAVPHFGVFVRMAVRTALRRAENLSLQWEWIDFADGVARVPVSSTKGKKRSRIVPLPDDVIEALRSLPRPIGSPYVYTNAATGERYSLSWASNSWRSLADRIGMEPSGDDPSVRLHDCRAKAFGDMVRDGVPITVAVKIGGWRTMDIVKRYLRITDEDARAARDVMNSPRRGPKRAPTRDATITRKKASSDP